MCSESSSTIHLKLRVTLSDATCEFSYRNEIYPCCHYVNFSEKFVLSHKSGLNNLKRNHIPPLIVNINIIQVNRWGLKSI